MTGRTGADGGASADHDELELARSLATSITARKTFMFFIHVLGVVSRRKATAIKIRRLFTFGDGLLLFVTGWRPESASVCAYPSRTNAGGMKHHHAFVPRSRKIATAAASATSQPRTISSSAVSSMKSWLTPPMLGTNSMQAGIWRAMSCASWDAPLGMRIHRPGASASAAL